MQNATEDTEVKLCIQRRQVEAYQFYLYNKEVIMQERTQPYSYTGFGATSQLHFIL